jgi:hypothetical protein
MMTIIIKTTQDQQDKRERKTPSNDRPTHLVLRRHTSAALRLPARPARSPLVGISTNIRRALSGLQGGHI